MKPVKVLLWSAAGVVTLAIVLLVMRVNDIFGVGDPPITVGDPGIMLPGSQQQQQVAQDPTSYILVSAPTTFPQTGYKAHVWFDYGNNVKFKHGTAIDPHSCPFFRPCDVTLSYVGTGHSGTVEIRRWGLVLGTEIIFSEDLKNWKVASGSPGTTGLSQITLDYASGKTSATLGTDPTDLCLNEHICLVEHCGSSTCP